MAEPLLGGMAQTAADRSEPILRCGNTNCGGCGMSIVHQFLGRAAGDRPVQLVIPTCCAIVAAGPFPWSSYGAPVVATTFASGASVATALAWAAKLNGEKTRVICFAGDGGTFDIGMATVSGAAERNEDILYLCYDNEIYGNTGGQRSSATPRGAATTTTPTGNELAKKDIVGIMAAHRIPYVATVSLAHPDDALRKMRDALDMEGFRFLHVLSPCPTGWKSEPGDGVELIRLAVKSGLYPIYEVFGGRRFVINVEPEMTPGALENYHAKQGRFRKAGIDLSRVREAIADEWDYLRARAAQGAARNA